MSRIQFIEGTAKIRAGDVVVGDRLDFEGDRYADPERFADPDGDYGPSEFEYEFAEVIGKKWEGEGCIVIETTQTTVGFPPDHLIDADGEQPEAVFYDCGICEHYHPNGFHGDCRDDSNRFTADQLDERYGPEGTGWRLIDMEDAD